MTFRPTQYARAFFESTAEGVPYEIAKERLLGLLAKNGDAHRAARVVYEIEKLEVAKQSGMMVQVEFAHEPQRLDEKKIRDQFTMTDRITSRINPELIAGTRITLNDESELDLSLAGKMRMLFHH